MLNPFTRDAVDLPSLGPVVHQVILCRLTMLNMNAAVCNSASSIAVVALFPGTGVMLAAEPGRLNWEVLHKYVAFMSVLPYQGRLYATMADSREIMQLYPRSTHPMLAHVPNGFGEPMQCKFYLVESGGQVLLAVQYLTVGADPNSLQCFAYKVYTVDVDGRRPEPLSPVSSLGDRALFLSKHRCLSVSARDLPSVTGGSIYFSLFYHKDPVVVHSLRTGLTEQLSTACLIHNGKDRVRPSVRPFTIADHLLTFCHPLEWTNGLMFHEYHFIPESFQELKNKIKAKDSQVRFPQDAHSVFLATKKHARSPRFALPSE